MKYLILLLIIGLIGCGTELDLGITPEGLEPLAETPDFEPKKQDRSKSYQVDVEIVNEGGMPYYFWHEGESPVEYTKDTVTTVVIPAKEKFIDVPVHVGRRSIAPRYYCRVRREESIWFVLTGGVLECPQS